MLSRRSTRRISRPNTTISARPSVMPSSSPILSRRNATQRLSRRNTVPSTISSSRRLTRRNATISATPSPIQSQISTRNVMMSTTALPSQRLTPSVPQRYTRRTASTFPSEKEIIPEKFVEIKTWKYMWNDILSDPEFRNDYLLRGRSFGDYRLQKNGSIIYNLKKKARINKGTFYLKFGDLAHYVAYNIIGKDIIIFDSSNPGGTYSDCLNDFIDIIENIKIKPFKGKKIKFETKYNTPQTHPNDSFCQTYSLGYLSDNIKIHDLMKTANSVVSRKELFLICKEFINMVEFEEICVDSQWFTDSMNFNKRKYKTQIWTPKQFLDFSRALTLDEFEKLFV